MEVSKGVPELCSWISVQVIISEPEEFPLDRCDLQKAACFNRIAPIVCDIKEEMEAYDHAIIKSDAALQKEQDASTIARIHLENSKALLSKGYLAQKRSEKEDLYEQAEDACKWGTEAIRAVAAQDLDFKLWEQHVCVLTHRADAVDGDLRAGYLEQAFEICDITLSRWQSQLSEQSKALFCLRYAEALNLLGIEENSQSPFEDALSKANEGLKICAEADERSPIKYHLRFALMQSLYNLATLQIVHLFSKKQVSMGEIAQIETRLNAAKTESDLLVIYLPIAFSYTMPSQILLKKVRDCIAKHLKSLENFEMKTMPWCLTKDWFTTHARFKYSADVNRILSLN